VNVVDSSAWLEYFADGPNAAEFAAAVEDTNALVVPALCIYEVFKRVAQQRGEVAAHTVVTVLAQGRVVALDADLAVAAARIAIAHKLAMADAVILATARHCAATLWTQDAHFRGMHGVEYRAPR
jgi:predicted nucleic acid-binding protein